MFSGKLKVKGDIYGYNRHAVFLSGLNVEFTHEGDMFTTGIYPCLIASSTPHINLKGTQQSLGSENTLTTTQTGGSFRHSGRVENKFISGAIARGISLGNSAGYDAIFSDAVIVVDDSFSPEGISATSNKDISVQGTVVSNAAPLNITNLIAGTVFINSPNVK